MISVTQFDSIYHWHEQGMSRREIARRLHVDVKTVRRQLRKMAAGATQPERTSPGSKLDPYRERLGRLIEDGRTAWSMYQELCTDPAFPASYELVKKYVARRRPRNVQVYERPEQVRKPKRTLANWYACAIKGTSCVAGRMWSCGRIHAGATPKWYSTKPCRRS